MEYNLGNVYLKLNSLTFKETVLGGTKEHEYNLLETRNRIELEILRAQDEEAWGIVSEAITVNNITIGTFASIVVETLDKMEKAPTEYYDRLLNDNLELVQNNDNKDILYFTFNFNADKIIFTVKLSEDGYLVYTVVDYIKENVITQMLNTLTEIETEGYTKPCVIEHLTDLKTKLDGVITSFTEARDLDPEVEPDPSCQSLLT